MPIPKSPALCVAALHPQYDADEPRNPMVRARAAREMKARAADRRRSLADEATFKRGCSVAELEFLAAMQDYNRASGRMFPTWSEALHVLRGLGYQK